MQLEDLLNVRQGRRIMPGLHFWFPEGMCWNDVLAKSRVIAQNVVDRKAGIEYEAVVQEIGCKKAGFALCETESGLSVVVPSLLDSSVNVPVYSVVPNNDTRIWGLAGNGALYFGQTDDARQGVLDLLRDSTWTPVVVLNGKVCFDRAQSNRVLIGSEIDEFDIEIERMYSDNFSNLILKTRHSRKVSSDVNGQGYSCTYFYSPELTIGANGFEVDYLEFGYVVEGLNGEKVLEVSLGVGKSDKRKDFPYHLSICLYDSLITIDDGPNGDIVISEGEDSFEVTGDLIKILIFSKKDYDLFENSHKYFRVKGSPGYTHHSAMCQSSSKNQVEALANAWRVFPESSVSQAIACVLDGVARFHGQNDFRGYKKIDFETTVGNILGSLTKQRYYTLAELMHLDPIVIS